MELVDQYPRGSLDLALAMMVTPLLGATLSTTQSHPLSDTPVKVHLGREIGEYKEALTQS